VPDFTPTLELPVADAGVADAVAEPAPAPGLAPEPEVTLEPASEPALDFTPTPTPEPEGAWVESEPTTLTLPVIGTAGILVVDDPHPGTRSVESLAISPRRARLALITLAAGAFIAGVNEASVVAMSPHIARGLGVSVASIGLLVTAFSATVVLATLPLTLLTQRVSKRVTLPAALGVWTVGVALAASASSLAHLAIGRMVSASAHSLFWAMLAPTAVSLFAPHLRARTLTRVMVGSAMAGVIGTPVVVLVASHVSWRLPYWVLCGAGLVVATTLAFVLPRTARTSSTTPHAHSRGDAPSGRVFARVLVVTAIAAISTSTTWTYIVSYYTHQSGVPAAAVPVMFAIGGVVAVGTTLAIGPVLARRGVHTVVVALALLTVAWSILAIGWQWTAVAAQVMQSAGWAALVAALLNWAMHHTPWRTDVGAATYTAVFASGSALGPLVGSVVVGAWSTRALPLVSMALTLVAAVLAIRAGLLSRAVGALAPTAQADPTQAATVKQDPASASESTPE